MNERQRQKIIAGLGKRDPLTDLKFRVDGETVCDGYVRQTVSYQVTDTERINAYLLIPDNKKEKNPAIVAIHQHAVWFNIGKKEPCGLLGEEEFAYGVDLVKRGYVVLCPDLLCFEERRYGKYFEEKYNRSCEFEKIVNQYLLAEGKTMCGKYLYDLVAAVDVLCSLDYVDTSRIGTIGHSTGGQCAIWLAWYDRRIHTCVCSCGFAKVKDLRKKWIGHNLAMIFPGMAKVCDYDELIAAIAPRNFLFTCGNYDPTFLMPSCREAEKYCAKKYGEMDCANNFRAVFFEGWHWLKDDVKQKVYAFIDEKMSGD